MYIYYIIAAIVVILSWLVLKAYKEPVPARVLTDRVNRPSIKVTPKAKNLLNDKEVESLIERLEDIIADLDSARD